VKYRRLRELGLGAVVSAGSGPHLLAGEIISNVKWTTTMVVAFAVAFALGRGQWPGATAQAQAQAPALTALDYAELGQLINRYAYVIDTCSNNGYDYADLFAPDGFFAPEQGGKIGAKFQGREQLAAVSGGGSRGCKNVGWIVQGVKHIYVNHIITPAADGATGTVDMLMIGLNNDPFRIRHEGYYEDSYVKTAQGWKFRSRIHHVPPPSAVPPPAVPPPAGPAPLAPVQR
jgi:hypothetical protein